MTARRWGALAAAAGALVLAVVLAVLAADVLRWRGHLERADLRYAAEPSAAGRWHPDTRLGGLSTRLLGVDDDVAFRRAAQRFRAVRPGVPAAVLGDVAKRARADAALARITRGDESPKRRSLAATYRGVLAFEEARGADAEAPVFLRRSATEFRHAIRLDAGNDDAKYNLELVLRLLDTLDSEAAGGDAGQRGDTPASGAGAASSGSGY